MNRPHTIIIAEAGVNHNGSPELARQMIAEARKAGADYVKFQAVARVENLIATSAPMARYQKKNTGKDESQLEMVRQLMLPLEEYAMLAECCREEGIGFVATPFDIPSIGYLAGLGMDFMKVPSGEITDLPYLRAVAEAGLPVVMSTGMANMAEVGEAVEVLLRGGIDLKDITLLHCTTEYPTPYEEVNLRAMLAMGREFGTAVGYSDHTRGIEVAVGAAALGASVIEKHFTLDRSLPGPDHKASLTPAELRSMVSAVRHIEAALGNGEKTVAPSEQANIAVARRSIVAVRPIEAGAVITADDIAAKRPGTGVSPMRWDEVVGSRAKRRFEPDELIEL